MSCRTLSGSGRKVDSPVDSPVWWDQMDLEGKYWASLCEGRRGTRALNARGKELKEHEHLRHYRPHFTWQPNTQSAAMSSGYKPLFLAPCPWLHASVTTVPFDYDAAATAIAKHFQMEPEELQPFMKAVSTCNTWLLRPPVPQDLDDPQNRRGVMQLMLPLILVDVLLHVSNPYPAPLVERALKRMSHTISQLFLARSDWVEMLRESHSCYIKHADKSSSSTTIRGKTQNKKSALLELWQAMKIDNPLKIVMRNLTQVALVLALYMLGDIDMSGQGRAAYLKQSAKAQGVVLTAAAEADKAVANTDVGLMMAPAFVAISHSPLALLSPIAYGTNRYKSRLPLLENWRDLGNRHRLILDNPLGLLERKLWALIFRLARREIDEVQLLQEFYQSDLAVQFLSPDDTPLPSPGYGLKFASDLLVAMTETFGEEDQDLAVQVVPPIEQADDQSPPKKRKLRHVDDGATASTSDPPHPRASEAAGQQVADEPPSKRRNVKHVGGDNATASMRTSLRPRAPKANAPVTSSRTPATKKHRPRPRPRKSSLPEDKEVEGEEEGDGDTDGEGAMGIPQYKRLRWFAISNHWRPRSTRDADVLVQKALDPEQILKPTVLHDLADDDTLSLLNAGSLSLLPKTLPIRSSQRHTNIVTRFLMPQCEKSGRDLPLHVHPDAQKLHTSGLTVSEDGVPLLPDIIPSDLQSIVYVAHEDRWNSLIAKQRQEVLRNRAALIIHRNPYLHDGRKIYFDEEGFEAFTHLDRYAFIQGMGPVAVGKEAPLQAGRPRDLLACRDMMLGSSSTGTHHPAPALDPAPDSESAAGSGSGDGSRRPASDPAPADNGSAAGSGSGDGRLAPDPVPADNESAGSGDGRLAPDPAPAGNESTGSGDGRLAPDPAPDHNESAGSGDGRKRPAAQRLNMLSNTLPNKTLAMPPGWSDLATHEFACTWVDKLSDVPPYELPWDDLTWAIFATSDAFTWIHEDVMFTVADLAEGKKAWFLGRRRTDLAASDLRGNMRSRLAFNTFNGWTDMTNVWVFEQVHLTPYTTLYMPAFIPHCVMSLTNCIGVGRHGIPASNLSHCVFVTLHNTVVADSMTNANHEPARRLLIRIFIFIALAFVDPQNGNPRTNHQSSRPTSRMAAHLPDITTSNGVLDLLALRSFIVLFVALNGSSYASLVDRDEKNIMQLEVEAARELSLAWKLAHDLVEHISSGFTFDTAVPSSPSDAKVPTTFSEAADVGALLRSLWSLWRSQCTGTFRRYI
ncbi:hypothetical protein B0H14DRAFT_2636593 [Mycena olivaceomarginata]|nr:hypothetical protein B0H14DRAFT_2636593 [Mycena olivaceomarginata]